MANRWKILVLTLIAALSVAACAAKQIQPPSDLVLTNETWGYYQTYLSDISPNRPGAFAVSVDGRSAFYMWCQDVLCMGGPTYKRDAIKGCEKFGRECLVFAYRDEIIVPYKLEGQ
jgi:hypothetical protein